MSNELTAAMVNELPNERLQKIPNAMIAPVVADDGRRTARTKNRGHSTMHPATNSDPAILAMGDMNGGPIRNFLGAVESCSLVATINGS